MSALEYVLRIIESVTGQGQAQPRDRAPEFVLSLPGHFGHLRPTGTRCQFCTGFDPDSKVEFGSGRLSVALLSLYVLNRPVHKTKVTIKKSTYSLAMAIF
ncbi:unnamed protein product [Prunus armeniaca]